jgi:DNA polymerase-4
VIACVQIPFFAAAVERLRDPLLAGAPLVIVDVETVQAVSEEALRCEVHPGMGLAQAEAICPEAHYLPARPSRYRTTFRHLVEGLSTFSHTIEAVHAWDSEPNGSARFYVDLGRVKPDDAVGMARQMTQAITEDPGLNPFIGLAESKFPARVAATCEGPGEVVLIEPGSEAEYLGSLPIVLLPLEDEVARQLALLGMHTLGDLSALPAEAVLARFGREGLFLQKLAQGRDERALLPYVHEKEEQIEHRLDEPVADRGTVEAILQQMAGDLAARLCSTDQVACGVCLLLDLEDRGEQETALTLTHPVSSEGELAKRLETLLERLPVSSGILGVAVRLSGLSPAIGKQLDLFPPEGGTQDRLQSQLDHLVRRYGPEGFFWIDLLEERSHFPEERFQLRRVLEEAA